MLPSQLLTLDFAASIFGTNYAQGPMPFAYGLLEGANPADATVTTPDPTPWFAGFVFGNLNRGR